LSFKEFLCYLMAFQNCPLVGADVVELAPHYDASGVSAVVAAKVIREVLLLSQ
jgi:agmatinase